MATLKLTVSQQQAVQSFFINLRNLAGLNPNGLLDSVGLAVASVINGNVSLASYATGSLPAPAVAGDLAYNSTLNTLQFYNGTTWTTAGGGTTPTLAVVYSSGTSSTDSTLTLNSTNGPLSLLYQALASTNTTALQLQNTTAATLGGQQQSSPAFAMIGQGTQTTTNTSQPVGWLVQATPFETTIGASALDFYSSVNGTLTSRLHIKAANQNGKGGTIIYGDNTEASRLYLSGSAGSDNYATLSALSSSIDFNFNKAQGVTITGNTGIDLTMNVGGLTPHYDLNNTIGDSTHRWNAVYTQHLVGGQASVPTAVAGTGAGTAPTITVGAGSTDLAGTVTVLTGSTPAGTNATIVTITFNTAYGAVPRVLLEPSNPASSALFSTTAPAVYQANTSTTTFAISGGTVGLAGATTYVWNYFVVQ